MPRSSKHPALRFKAPAHIEKGKALKDLLDSKLIALIGESFAAVSKDFDAKAFSKQARSGLEDLTLAQRAAHIAQAMAKQLPNDFEELLPIFLKALGPDLHETEVIGLAGFFYFPHNHLIAQTACSNVTAGLEACYALTKCFTAEFAIRPLFEANTTAVRKTLNRWKSDESLHVRRLVSEGTRPRLPWAGHLKSVIKKPQLTLPYLRALKNDPSLYVRRSVANHMGDIAKDHLDLVLKELSAWLKQSEKLATEQSQALKWVIRHALRNPDKKGIAAAQELRKQAK